ncbi:DJ-1/PfpI family protein [Indioceanicola profundi]|uniref:DJ-1/PfpI family protein n=1 Tax=Indioceanicola profundi TaxID=2220096 RepID=UPI000E6ACABC|nr:DJ-1/PfpI family protein [Indioceanicola profundi]
MTDQPLAGKNVAILVANGFEELEMTEPQRALLKLGANLKIISPEQGLVNGWHGTAWGHYFPVDKQVGDVLAADFDLLLLPGGERSVAKLVNNPHTRRILGSFMDAGKGVAAIGTGVSLLATAQKAKARTLTSAPAVADALKAEGADWSEEPVVVDRYLVTAQGQEHLDAFVEAVTRTFVQAVEQRKQAA